MTILTITEGQLIWSIGVALLVFASFMFFRFYDPQYDVNKDLATMVALLVLAGIILVIGGLNMDYQLIMVEVKK